VGKTRRTPSKTQVSSAGTDKSPSGKFYNKCAELFERSRTTDEVEQEIAASLERYSETSAPRYAREGRLGEQVKECHRKWSGDDQNNPLPQRPRGKQDQVAIAFAKQYADAFRYVAAWNRWLEWDGVRWQFEETLHAFDKARELLRDSLDKADAKTVAAVVTLARADRMLAATTAQWDADPWHLGTPQGTINLRTGQMRKPAPHDYITKILKVAPGGDCPRWRKFLDRITGGDVELQRYLQRVCGYALTGDISEEALFFLYGTGANGKSVFIRTITAILGDYHRTAPMETFTVSKHDRHPTDLAMLRGARLVTAMETQEGRIWDEAKIKYMTGGDRIAARFMRQDFFEYVPQFKLMIAGNHRPAIISNDEAIRRRMNLIPFMVTIPEEERDPELSKKLEREWPGILAWMVEGCLAWQRERLNPPQAVRKSMEDYLQSEDTLATWIAEYCKVGKQLWASSASLWQSWKVWTEQRNERVGSQKRFSQRLEEKGFRPGKNASDMRGFAGLRLRR
jgi:putative DNA primase/helicase